MGTAAERLNAVGTIHGIKSFSEVHAGPAWLGFGAYFGRFVSTAGSHLLHGANLNQSRLLRLVSASFKLGVNGRKVRQVGNPEGSLQAACGLWLCSFCHIVPMAARTHPLNSVLNRGNHAGFGD
jgi:hypothetical protein